MTISTHTVPSPALCRAASSRVDPCLADGCAGMTRSGAIHCESCERGALEQALAHDALRWSPGLPLAEAGRLAVERADEDAALARLDAAQRLVTRRAGRLAWQVLARCEAGLRAAGVRL